MATSLLLLLLLLPLLAVSAAARPGPCHTLILFTTTASSFDDVVFPHSNPLPGPRSVTVFFTRIRPAYPADPRPIQSTREPWIPDPSVGASFKDRSKDILGVVGSLLFGVGCGALTAATLFLVWSLFAPRSFAYDSEDEAEAEFDDASLKKAGYVAIPAAEKLAPAKEVV